MEKIKLIRHLVYSDTSYISDLYEIFTGVKPETLITRNQSKKAGAAIPIFSAEISAQETRSYKVSTLDMLREIMPELEKDGTIDLAVSPSKSTSRFGWIEGELSAFISRNSVQKKDKEEILSIEKMYHIHVDNKTKVALMTVPEYFSSGMDSFARLQGVLVKEISIPIRAYVRLTSVKTWGDQFIAIPYTILETDGNPRGDG